MTIAEIKAINGVTATEVLSGMYKVTPPTGKYFSLGDNVFSQEVYINANADITLEVVTKAKKEKMEAEAAKAAEAAATTEPEAIEDNA